MDRERRWEAHSLTLADPLRSLSLRQTATPTAAMERVAYARDGNGDRSGEGRRARPSLAQMMR